MAKGMDRKKETKKPKRKSPDEFHRRQPPSWLAARNPRDFFPV